MLVDQELLAGHRYCHNRLLGQEILVAGYFLLKNRYCWQALRLLVALALLLVNSKAGYFLLAVS